MSNKTRKWRSTIAIVLVICMLFSIFPVAAFAEEPEINYVSLGDSMTNGYGLPGYDGNTGVEDYGEGSYANLFAQWLATENGATVNHAQLGMSAMRAEDLHWLLELDYTDDTAIAITDGAWDEATWNAKFSTGDYWTWNELCDDYRFAVAAYAIENDGAIGKITDDEAAIVAEYYQTAVKEADIISLGMGNGNFGVFAFGRIMEAIGFRGTPDDALIYNVERAIAECDLETQAKILELKEELYAVVEEKVGTSINANPALEALANTVVYTGLSYVLNYAGSIEAILQLNPDAEIILVALMNTFDSDESVTGDVTLGDLMNVVFTPLNAYIAALPTAMQAAGNEVYADATFYYAEANSVECLVNTYGDDFYKPDGTPNDASIIRDRFVQDIVGDNSDGMIWNLLSGTALGSSLVNITIEDVEEYSACQDDVAKATWAAQNHTKATSMALYMAFETAIIDAATAPVTLDSILNLNSVDFTPVMDEFYGNIAANSALKVSAATTAVANIVGLDVVYVQAALTDTEVAAQQIVKKTIENNLPAGVTFDMWVEDSVNAATYASSVATTKAKLDNAVDSVEVLSTFLALPETLSDALKQDDAINGLLGLFSRCVVGNGLGGHPSAGGHETLYEAVKDAYVNEHTALDETLENLEAVRDIIVEYYDEAYAYAYAEADKAGYIDAAIAGIEGVKAELEGVKAAVEAYESEMTPAFKAQVVEQIDDVIDVLKEAQDLIETADELDQDTLDALMELLGEAGEMMTQLGNTLTQAGVDVNQLAIIPALNEAQRVLVEEVLPEINETLQNAVAEGTAWLMDKAQDAIDALVDALPGMAQFAHDYVYNYLLNNPAEVIAFFNEYGDEIIDAVSEYGPYALAAVAYIADTYGDEILAFVMENDEEILEVTAMLLKEHGPHAVQLIQVYAEELGYCQAVRELIADLEDQIADLKAQLEDELKAQLEDLKAELEDLYAQLENASDDVKEQIQNAIEEVEKLIDEVEQKIAEIEAAIAELEAQLEAAQKALEEAIDAVEAVVEAIKDAIEAGVETVEEILAVIEDIVKVAEDTIAGVKTAIEGIQNAVEDIVEFVDELIANGIVAAEMIAEIIDTVMDIIDGVKAGLEQGDIDAAIEAIRNELTNGYEELSAMLAAIDTAIAEELDAIVGDLEAALAQAQDEFEEALYNATHGKLACDAKTIAVYGGETVATEDGYAAIVAEEWGLTQTEAVDMADVILYQADPQIFVTALLDSVSGDYAANWAKYIGDEAVLAYLEQAKAELKDVLADEYGEEAAAVAEPLVDSFLFAVVEYAIANIETIEYLSRINEDALIVAAGMYNPVQGLSVTYGGETIDIEAMCQYLIEVTDVYNLLYAIAAQNAVFVDVSEAEAAAFDNVDVDSLLARAMALKAEAVVLLKDAAKALEENDMAKANALMAQAEALYAQVDEIVEDVMPLVESLDSSYATEAGHAYIAEQILAAIEKTDHECEWTYDDTEHCYYCENCGEEFVCGPHELDGEEDTVCDVCGYERIIIDPTPEITTSSIVVYYWNETDTAIKEATVEEITTTGSYDFAIPAIDNYNFVNVIDKDENDDNDYDVAQDNTSFTVNVNTMPTSGSALEFVLKYGAASGGEEDDTIAVTGVTLDKDTLSLKVGNTAALTATVAPDNATNKAVTWASSDESVATVADGVVTAVAKGTATITVTTVDGAFTDTCAVTVTKASSGGSFGGGGGGAYTKAKPEVIVPDNAVPAGVTVTADYADYQTVNGAQDFAAKDNNIAVIGGRDSSAEVIVKPAGAVESFTHPVQLVVPVSKSALQNVDDVNKLTLALVTTDAQGNIQLTYVGGNYDASKGTFTAYVNQPGKYVLVEKLDLVKIELTIDRYVIFVNGEPIINDVPSRIVNNRTLAPAARVLHHMGCTVEWLSDTRTVAVTLPNGDVLNLPVDEPIPGFGAAPVIENDRTLVPIAYIADMMDAHVQWVGNDRKVIIVK